MTPRPNATECLDSVNRSRAETCQARGFGVDACTQRARCLSELQRPRGQVALSLSLTYTTPTTTHSRVNHISSEQHSLSKKYHS